MSPFRTSCTATMVAVICLVFSATCSAQSMNGTWKVDSGMIHGKTVPPHVVAAMQLEITNNTFSADSGNLASTGAIVANPQASPAQVSFTIDAGDDHGRQVNAIYEFRNGQLFLTYSEDDTFPTGFESTEENRYLSLTYSSGTRAVGGAAAPAARGGGGRFSPGGGTAGRAPQRPRNSPPAAAAPSGNSGAGLID